MKLLDHPSGEASAIGTPITGKNEIAINANTTDWKAIVMVMILQATNRLNRLKDFYQDDYYPLKLYKYLCQNSHNNK